MNHFDLFSGLGGWLLAAKALNWNTLAACEIDSFCQRLLAYRFPNLKVFPDITKIDDNILRQEGIIKEGINQVDVVTGSFPCQDVSIANPKKEGLYGKRSGLWFDMFRIIQRLKPRWVVGENVSGLASMGLDVVRDALEAEDYQVRCFIIPACAAGLPQRRNRVWFVANYCGGGLGGSRSDRLARSLLQNQNRLSTQDSAFWDGWLNRVVTPDQALAAYTGRCATTPIDGARSFEKGAGGWLPVVSELCGTAYGTTEELDKNRIRVIGNSIVPALAHRILLAIDTIEKLAHAEI